MTGSTAPGFAALKHSEANTHPIHRATALLEQALHTPLQVDKPEAPSHSTSANMEDPATPQAQQQLVDAARQLPATHRVDVSALDPSRSAVLEDDDEGKANYAVHSQLRGLVDAFHDRQRQASLIVAASVAGAVFLTLCGLLLLFGSASEAGPNKALGLYENTLPAGHGGRTASAQAGDVDAPRTASELIKIRPGETIALGRLIPLRSSRYVLLRGLPTEMTLSAGRPTGDGSWMIKGEDVADLTLVSNRSARGDHPIEIYFLESADGHQARQQLTLRVDARPKLYAAGLSFGWPDFLVDAAKTLGEKEAASKTPAAITLAPHGLSRIDMEAARRELTALARNGNADAAYRLALSYDRDVLTLAGLQDIASDTKTAQSWYERAAEAGHADAARRLETLLKQRSGA